MAKYAIVQSSDLLKRGWSAREHVYPRPWRIIDGVSGIEIHALDSDDIRYDDAVSATRKCVLFYKRAMTLVDAQGDVMEAFDVEVRVRKL